MMSQKDGWQIWLTATYDVTTKQDWLMQRKLQVMTRTLTINMFSLNPLGWVNPLGGKKPKTLEPRKSKSVPGKSSTWVWTGTTIKPVQKTPGQHYIKTTKNLFKINKYTKPFSAKTFSLNLSRKEGDCKYHFKIKFPKLHLHLHLEVPY